MPQIGKSAKLYQERRLSAFQDTLRGPGPQIYLPDNAVNFLPLEPPHRPATVSPCNKQNTVDIGRTETWPFGDNHAYE
jgi:hypothetical protein